MSAARARKIVEGRSDPKPRRITDLLSGQSLINSDPSRFYLWANERGDFDAEYYLALASGLDVPDSEGYRLERHAGEVSGTLRVRIGSIAKEGEPFRHKGHVLISCPKEFKLLIDEVGELGMTGQRATDQKVARSKKNRGQHDDLSGIQAPGISITSGRPDGLPEED